MKCIDSHQNNVQDTGIDRYTPHGPSNLKRTQISFFSSIAIVTTRLSRGLRDVTGSTGSTARSKMISFTTSISRGLRTTECSVTGSTARSKMISFALTVSSTPRKLAEVGVRVVGVVAEEAFVGGSVWAGWCVAACW